MLTDFHRAPLKPAYISFYGAWRDACVDGALPLRTDIRLQQFARFAGNMHIYELKSPTHLSCRLMGSDISDRLTSFAPDENVFDFLGDDKKPHVIRWWNAMANQPCGAFTQFSVGYKSGANRMVETLILPIIGMRDNVLFLVYNNKPSYIDTDEPRSSVKLANSGSKSKYIDIGFGIPAAQSNKED